MRPMKRIVAALAALTMTAGLALAQTFPEGAWLPITKIATAGGGAGGTQVDLEWDDFSDLIGVEVYETATLDDPASWVRTSIIKDGMPTTRFGLDEGGVEAGSLTSQKFYRLRGIRGAPGSGGAPVKGGDGNWYANVGTNSLGNDVYIQLNPDGTPAVPPSVWTNVINGGVQIWPAGGGTGPGGCECDATCDCLAKNGLAKVDPDGTVIVTRPPRTPPGTTPGGDLILEPGDVIVPPAPYAPIVVPEPGGHYDESIPGIVLDTAPPATILVPGGTAVIGGLYPSVVLPGSDGKLNTDDDVTVKPAIIDNVDPGTGIITVPGGSVVSTNGVPVVVPGVNDTLTPAGSFPGGTVVLPDGTIIVPSNPPNSPPTPSINPDGTVTVGGGDTILLPPYDTPFVVEAPGGIFNPHAVPPCIIPPTGPVIPVVPGVPTTHVAVTGITAGMALTMTAGGTPLTLAGTVAPGNASYSTIVWSIASSTAAGAAISGGQLTATGTGTVTVRATVANGTAVGTAYVQDFAVTVNASYTSDPSVTWNGVDHTIMIDLTTYAVTRLPADFDVKSDNLSKTEHLYLRRINAGTFEMGAPSHELGYAANQAQKTVTLSSGYYVGVYAVTAYQYAKINGTATPANSARPQASIAWNTIRGTAAPTVGSTPGGWLATLEFNVKNGPSKLALGFDLPTEAQWEFACRAGTVGTFSDRNTIVGTGTTDAALKDTLGLIAWYTSNNTEGTGSGTKDVGLKNGNPAGLYDVHGNVYEWCRDAWNGSAALVGGTDPNQGTSGSNRSVRGGGYGVNANGCRSAYRHDYTPSSTGAGVGFRLGAFGAVVP